MSLSSAAQSFVDSLVYFAPVTAAFHALLTVAEVALLRRPALDGRASARRAVAWLALVLALSLGAIALTHNPFYALNLLAHALFIHGPALASVLVWRLAARRAKVAWALVGLALVAVTIEAFVIEPTALTVRRITVRSARLRRPLRAVVLADLQFDRFDEHTRRALRLAMDERPDLLLLPGDYAQRPLARGGAALRAEANAYLRAIHFGAPLGIYAVEGNVEWEPGWQSMFDGLDARVFDRVQRYELDELVVTGMGLSQSQDRALSLGAEAKFHIAIGHAPDFALGDVPADLLVAGHTHGGQVQLPGIGPLMTLSAVPRAWAAGNEAIALDRRRTLVVSRGVGLERGAAPRLRFRCRPEVVVIELRPAP